MSIRMKWGHMSEFQLARWKLTGWYMVILLVLIGVFTYLTLDAKQSAFVRVYQVVDSGSPGSPQVKELSDRFEEFNQRFKERLIIFDVVLVFISGWLSYFLSGKTLKPIKLMVEEQTQFAGDVSHSLRTPLTTMSLELSSYKRSKTTALSQKKLMVESMEDEIRSMTNLIDGMLALVRSGTDPMKQYHTEVNLAQMIVGLHEKMQSLAAAKHQTFTIQVKKGLMIHGNQDQLKQVLMILLDNAIKYSGKGAKILLTAEKTSQSIHITINDTGPGIEAAELPHIFERYYRGSSKIKGTGLGLAIAHRLVTYHQGTISVQSRKGRGTTFSLRFPR